MGAGNSRSVIQEQIVSTVCEAVVKSSQSSNQSCTVGFDASQIANLNLENCRVRELRVDQDMMIKIDWACMAKAQVTSEQQAAAQNLFQSLMKNTSVENGSLFPPLEFGNDTEVRQTLIANASNKILTESVISSVQQQFASVSNRQSIVLGCRSSDFGVIDLRQAIRSDVAIKFTLDAILQNGQAAEALNDLSTSMEQQATKNDMTWIIFIVVGFVLVLGIIIFAVMRTVGKAVPNVGVGLGAPVQQQGAAVTSFGQTMYAPEQAARHKRYHYQH